MPESACLRGPCASLKEWAAEPKQGCGVGEVPDDIGTSFDLAVEPFERVGAPDLAPVTGAIGKRVTVRVIGVDPYRLDADADGSGCDSLS